MPLSTEISHPLYMPSAWLLDNAFTQTIEKYLTPDMLLAGAQVLAISIAVVVAVIYLYLFNKKRSFFYTDRIRKFLENWISQIIMEDVEESSEMSKKIQRVLKNNTARQFAIDELILCKKNFSGAVAENIVTPLHGIGFKNLFAKKIIEQKQLAY